MMMDDDDDDDDEKVTVNFLFELYNIYMLCPRYRAIEIIYKCMRLCVCVRGHTHARACTR